MNGEMLFGAVQGTAIPTHSPVFNQVADINDLRSKKSISGALISLHNLWKTIEHVELMRNLATDMECFKRHIMKHYPGEVTACFEFVDNTREKGINYAMHKARIDLVAEQETKQRNISAWWS